MNQQTTEAILKELMRIFDTADIFPIREDVFHRMAEFLYSLPDDNEIATRKILEYIEWYIDNCFGTTPHLRGLEKWLDKEE